MVHKILRLQLILYHIRKCYALQPANFPAGLNVCEWSVAQYRQNPRFDIFGVAKEVECIYLLAFYHVHFTREVRIHLNQVVSIKSIRRGILES